VDVDQLFIHTLRDLERRTAATNEYEVLLSAALLRKLLLDQERLMDQANRSYRLDLRFRISGVSPFEQQMGQEPDLLGA
jgi:cobalamin biosynthesis protein CobT